MASAMVKLEYGRLVELLTKYPRYLPTRLKELTIGTQRCSRMLRILEEQKKSTIIVIARKGNKVVGWASFVPTQSDASNGPNAYYIEINVFVHKDHRRQGIGAILIEEGKDLMRYRKYKFVVQPWSSTATKFFMKLNMCSTN